MSAAGNSLENKTIGIITLKIVPVLMLAYFIAFIDRVNIGFAAAEMNADLGLSTAIYGLGAGIFFIGYFLFETPCRLKNEHAKIQHTENTHIVNVAGYRPGIPY